MPLRGWKIKKIWKLLVTCLNIVSFLLSSLPPSFSLLSPSLSLLSPLSLPLPFSYQVVPYVYIIVRVSIDKLLENFFSFCRPLQSKVTASFELPKTHFVNNFVFIFPFLYLSQALFKPSCLFVNHASIQQNLKHYVAFLSLHCSPFLSLHCSPFLSLHCSPFLSLHCSPLRGKAHFVSFKFVQERIFPKKSSICIQYRESDVVVAQKVLGDSIPEPVLRVMPLIL